MRKFYAFLILFLCVCANAQLTTNYSVTLVVTNTAGTANGQFIVFSSPLSATRIFSNSAPNAANWILTGTNIGQVVTNIFSSYVASPQANARLLPLTTTNSLTWVGFPGKSLTVLLSSGWATNSYSTNVSTNAFGVRVPFTVEGTAERQFVGAELANYLNVSTNKLNAGTTLMNHFLDDASSFQVMAGTKAFTGAITFNQINVTNQTSSSTIQRLIVGTNLSFSSGAYISSPIATGGRWTNGLIISPTITNGVNVGNAFSSAGSKSGAEQFGSGATATDTNSTAIGANAAASGVSSSALGNNSVASGTNSSAVGYGAEADGVGSIAIGPSSIANDNYSIAIGSSASASHQNSIALGVGSSTTASNQVRIGTATINTSIAGLLMVDGSISNAVHTGNTTNSGSWSWLRTNNTGLANGANADVKIGNAQDVFVSGPSADFTINGVEAPAFTDTGHIPEVWLWNKTGKNMTIANDSGVDPTAANRILTGTGADVVNTNNPGLVHLRYDSVAARWAVYRQ